MGEEEELVEETTDGFRLDNDAKIKLTYIIQSSNRPLVHQSLETYRDGDPELTNMLTHLPDDLKQHLQHQQYNPEMYSNFILTYGTLQGLIPDPITGFPTPIFTIVAMVPISAPLTIRNQDDIHVGETLLAVPVLMPGDAQLIQNAIQNFLRSAYPELP